MNSTQKDRLVFREQIAKEFGSVLGATISFRAAKFLDAHDSRDAAVEWLKKPSTLKTKQLGKKTFYELCAALGMAVPEKVPRTVGWELQEAKKEIEALKAKIAEQEQIIKQHND